MVNLSPTCELWIDGTRVPDTGPDVAVPENMTALAGLTVSWGRTTLLDQPDPAVCSFSLYDPDPAATPVHWLDAVHTGSRVEVWAESEYTTPTPPELLPSGGFTAAPGGNAWPHAGYRDPPGNALADFVPPPAGTGRIRIATTAAMNRFLLATPKVDLGGGSTTEDIWVYIPPAPWDTAETNLAAWAHIPQLTAPAGTVVRIRGRFRIQAGASVTVFLRGVDTPFPTQNTLIGTGGIGLAGQGSTWVEFDRTLTLAQAWDHWVLVQFDTDSDLHWNTALIPAGTTWEQAWGSWDEYGGLSVDDLSVTIPEAGLADRRLVFAGHVTDVTATPTDHGALEVSANAADLLAFLANMTIGDQPWPAETLTNRAHRIVTLAQNPGPLIVDPGIATPVVSWRDVDAQTPGDLLADLAQTAGGVLWATGNTPTRTYLWLEDQLGGREAARIWEQVGQYADIVGARTFAPLSACDVLRDPVSWSQTSTDINTGVDVTWRAQTLDDEGNMQPTDMTVTVVDPTLQAIYGPQRLSVATELTTQVAAQTLAQRLLLLTTQRGWTLDGVTIATGQLPDTVTQPVDVRATTIMDVLDDVTRLGKAVAITDQPVYAPEGPTTPLYLDGGTYTFETGAWTLDLNLTPSGVLGKFARWTDFTATGWRWVDVNPALAWNDAIGAVGPGGTRMDPTWDQPDEEAA